MKKVIHFLHLWLGLLSGLVVFIVSLTGALYVFSEDINAWMNRDVNEVDVQQAPFIPIDSLLTLGKQSLTHKYGKHTQDYWNWQNLTITNQPGRSVRFDARKYENPDLSPVVYINPHTGVIIRTDDHAESKFWAVVIDLHTSLMLGEAGIWIVEIATLIFLVLVISGMILWWPKNKAARKQRFWFRWKETMRWKRKNYDLHNILGFYMCWIVIFMIITGLGWSFAWCNRAIHVALGGDSDRKEVTIPTYSAAIHKEAPIAKLYAQTKRLYPNAREYRISIIPYHGDGEPFPQNKPMEVLVYPSENYSTYNTLYFHPQTGNFISQLRFSEKTPSEKYDALSGDIHYGWIFGWPSKIAVFLACLVAASLPFTGFYIWWGRSRKKKSSNKSRAVTYPIA